MRREFVRPRRAPCRGTRPGAPSARTRAAPSSGARWRPRASAGSAPGAGRGPLRQHRADRARARTARSRPGSPRTASAPGRCRTRTRCRPCANTRKKRTASRADLVDQIAHVDVAAGALGDLHLLAALHHRHHLVQHVVGVSGGDAEVERLQAGAHPRHRAVVVRSLDVDDACAKPRSHLVTW